MTIGIYFIRNKIIKKMYVGQSINIEARWATHRYELKHSLHKNKKLQRSYLKHGKENFEFLIFKECKKSELNDLEQSIIDAYGVNNLYNIREEITDVRGSKNPFFGKNINYHQNKK